MPTRASKEPVAGKRATTKKAAKPAAKVAKKTAKKVARAEKEAAAASRPAPAKKTLPKPSPVAQAREANDGAKATAAAAAAAAGKSRSPRIKVVRVEASKPKPVVTVHAPEDLDFYRARLEEKRTQILSLYNAEARHGQESNEDGTEDLVDRANNAYSRELSFSISDSERALLMEVEDALDRLQSGEFGICQHSRRPIPAERLRAVPWARYCIESQELYEKGLLD